MQVGTGAQTEVQVKSHETKELQAIEIVGV